MTKEDTGTSERLRQQAEELIRRSSSGETQASPEEVRSLVMELRLYQTELEIQNDALREAQKEAEINRDRFSHLFHQAPIGYLTLDGAGIIREANQTFADMAGVDLETLYGASFPDWLAVGDRKIFLSRYKAFFRHPQGKRLELTLRSVKKAPIPVSLEGRRQPLFQDPDDSAPSPPPDRLLLLVNDISQQKRAENAGRESEERYRLLFDQSSDAIFVHDLEGRFLDVNEVAVQRLGYSRERLLKMSPRDIDTPEFGNRVGDRLREIRKTGHCFFETVHVTRRGLHIPTELSSRLIEYAGTPAVLSIARDITDRKREEDRLRQNEARFRLLAENMPVLINAVGQDGRFIFWNRQCEAVTGYAKEEILDAPDAMARLYPDPDYRATLRREWEASESGYRNRELVLTDRDGNHRTVLWSTLPPDLSYGPGISWAVGIDITDLRRSEAALLESRENLAITLRSIGDAVIATDDAGAVASMNPAAEMLTGWAETEVLGRPLTDIFLIRNSLTGEPAENPVERVLREGKVAGLANHTALVARDGTVRQIADSAAPIRRSDGTLTGVVMVFRDVTEEYRTREALRQKTAELDTFFSSSLDLLAIADTGGHFRRLNPEWERTLGYELAELEGASFFDYIHPDDVAPTKEAVATLSNQHPILNFTNRYRHQNGGYRWIEWRSFPVGDRIYACARDITRRIEAEEEIRLHQARLQSLFDISQYDAETPQELLDYALEQAIRLTGSKVGYIYHYDEEKRRFILNSWSREVMAECRITDPPHIFLMEKTGIWGEAVRQRRPIVVNDFQAPNPLKKGYPEGHVDLYKFMTIPVFMAGRIVAVVGLGNKETDYDEADVVQLTLLMDSVWKVTERKRVEEQLRRLAEAVHQTSEAVVITDPKGIIEYVNPSFERITGYSPDEAVGETPRILKSGHQDETFYRDLWATISAGEKWSGRFVNRRKDGAEFTEECSITPVKNDQGEIERFVAVKKDISGELKLEEQFRQSQRLESVGRLAAGVAHDLNNLLAPILGYAEMLLEELDTREEPRRKVAQIIRAAEGSRDLVRQLLAFGRKQILDIKVLDLRRVVRDLQKLMRRTIRENIALETFLSPDPCAVEADAGQLGQVLMNLAVNAQDAMPDGGTLTIEATRAHLDEAYCETHTSAQPGHYVMLAISDTGAGMDPETRKHIFEPFFTTKNDLGTGLGLATVYGIIKQHGGNIWVYSEPGKGTTFKIYLPAAEAEAAPGEEPERPAGDTQGVETVLVAEDNDMVRDLACRVLERQGYAVFTAATGREALQRLEGREGPVHLLLTDVVMPDMDGMALSRKVARRHPDVKVLFMSGYTENVIAHHGVLSEGVHFIQKPFSVADLARKVRESLEK